MHASISTFHGDPDELLARYDAMLAVIPAAKMQLHLCARTDDGIIIIDTCPSLEAYLAFHGPDGPFRALLREHGMPEPTVRDHPVHVAITGGLQVAA